MGLMSSLGGLVGFAMGGPAGAAVGAGVGTGIEGGDLKDAFKSAAMGFVGGGAGNAMSGFMQGGGGGGGNPLAQLLSGGGNQGGDQGIGAIMKALGASGQGSGGTGGGLPMGGGGGGGGIGSLLNNPTMMASLLRATEPRSIKMTSDLQDAQLATGERNPSFRGVQAMDIRKRNPARFTQRPTYAQGGLIEGPGTGTSDSIPGSIMQNGQPVEQIRVANNEFILREKDVEQIGNGDRDLGAAKLYAMQRRFDKGGRA